MQTLSRLQSSGEEAASLATRASRFLIPASGDLASRLTTEAELDSLKLLFAETLDILDSEVACFNHYSSTRSRSLFSFSIFSPSGV